jgi:hypothetical protein
MSAGSPPFIKIVNEAGRPSSAMPWRAAAARAAPGLREPAGGPQEDPGIVLTSIPSKSPARSPL